MNKKIQLLRSNTIYSPSNNLSAKEVAKAALDSLSNISDGEVVLVRYQETNDDVRSLVCVYHNAGNESGWTFFESASEFLTTDDWAQITNLSRTPYVELVSVSSTQTIDPYKMYNFGTVSTGLTIVFNTANEVQGYTKEYTIRFVAGNGCGITLPSGVLYVNGATPTYTTGHTYEINVVNNCAVVAEFY